MSMLQSFSARAKLTALIILLCALLVPLGIWNAKESKAQLLADKQETLKSTAQTAVGVVEYWAAKQKAGMSEKEAQDNAKNMISTLHYGSDGYFFINTKNLTTILNPFKPENVGKDMSAYKDPSGQLLYVEMREAAYKTGGGFIFYKTKKPKEPKDATDVPKMSYLVATHWDWMVGTGAYIDDIDAIARAGLIRFISVLAGLMLLLAAVGSLIASSITKPLRVAVAAAGAISQGDLRQPIPDLRTGEAGEIFGALASMQAKLATLVKGIQSQAESIQSRSRTMEKASQAVYASSVVQSESAAQAKSEVKAMSAGMATISKTAAERADNSSAATGEGLVVVKAAEAEMMRISDSIGKAAVSINELQKSSAAISQLTGEISSIASQTNLLALNAAIEAARAGESGRGFAVVADEVRKLAEGTTRSTETISQTVGSVGGATESARLAMGASVQMAAKGLELTRQAAVSIDKIKAGSDEARESVLLISSALAAQTTQGEAIERRIDGIAHMAQQNSAAVKDASEQAKGLSQVADDLSAAVSVFKI